MGFGSRACGILAPQPGIEPVRPSLEPLDHQGSSCLRLLVKDLGLNSIPLPPSLYRHTIVCSLMPSLPMSAFFFSLAKM